MRAVLILSLVWLLAGCGPIEPRFIPGGQRLPMIEVPPPLSYTPQEEELLNVFSAANPRLARKIINQSSAMRRALETYNARAWLNNARPLKALGYSDAEIIRLLGPAPRETISTGAAEASSKR